MLTDRQRQLLSAYVDGEAPQAEHDAALRLLQASAEARTLLRALQDDAERLRRLPPKPAPDLVAAIEEQIRARRLKPGIRRFATPTPTYPTWTAFAAAASVLLMVGTVSYFYFAAASRPGPAVVEGDGSGKSVPTPSPAESAPPIPAVATVPAPAKAPVEKPRPDVPAVPPERDPTDDGSKVAGTPSTPPGERDMTEAVPGLAAPVQDLELFKPAAVQIALTQVIGLRELEHDSARQTLRGELLKERAFRLEVPVRDTARSFERVQAALKAHGIGLLTDPIAQARQRWRQLRTNYVFYLEDLPPEVLVGMLQQLGVDDRKVDAKGKKEAPLFDKAVLNRMTREDYRELAELLGVDVTQPPRGSATPLGVDPRKPLSDKTGDQVMQSLTGQGSTPRSDAGKSLAKAPERMALALPYNPVRPKKGSAELRRFLDQRKAPKPGSLQVLLVLRGIG